MANAGKSPEEPPHKKSKPNHATSDAALDFFLEPLWQSLESFTSTKRIEGPVLAQELPASSTGSIIKKGSSRYDNAPSLFDLVQTNLLKMSTPAPSAPPSSNDSSTIPQKRPRLEITQYEATVETDTQYHTPPADLTNTQISPDTRKSRSSQINTTRAEYISAITVDTSTSNVPESSQSDTPDNVVDTDGHNQPTNISNDSSTHNVNVVQVNHDDDDSDMSIDQDDEELGAVEENTSRDAETNQPSVVVDVPDDQEFSAASTTTTTTTTHTVTKTTTTTAFPAANQRQSPGTSLNRTTSYHSLERYEEIDDEEENEEFVDTSEVLIDVEVEEEESSQSSDEFYDVKETFSATVSMATTPTINGEDADRQLQDDATPVIVNAVQDEQLELDTEDKQDDEANQPTDQGLEPGEISQESTTLDVVSTQEPNANEPAQSAANGDAGALEDGEIDTSNESQLNRVDDVVEADTNGNDGQPSVIEDASVSSVQQQSSESQDDPASIRDDQGVASYVMPTEQHVQHEQLQPIDQLTSQDDHLPSFGTEDEQLIDIEEVHLLMDHQDEQMAAQEPREEEATSTAIPQPQPDALIQEQQDDVLPAAVNSTLVDDQQVQHSDDNNTDENDQQVMDDTNADTTGSQLLESNRVHSFLLEEIQEILQEDSEGAEDQVLSVEKEPTPPTVSRVQAEIVVDDEEHDDASTSVAGNGVDVEMQDAIEESDVEEAAPSQPASIMDDSVQEFASMRDSFALDLIQSQTSVSQQSEDVEEYELEESDGIVEDTQEPNVVVVIESRPAAVATTDNDTYLDLMTSSDEGEPDVVVVAESRPAAASVMDSDTYLDLMTSSEEEEQGKPGDDVDFIDLDPMDDDYDDDDEDDLMMDAMTTDENDQQDIQTQQPVAVALDDVPLSCLTADMGVMGGRTVCNMDLPPYAHVPIWWYDAHDSNQKGVVYLFGKVFDDQQDKYVSCCVRIQNIARELYILPRQFEVDDEGNPTRIRVDLNDVQHELETLLEHKKVSTYKMTTCEKQYAFSGTDIPRRATYIKLQYDYKDYEFPTTQSGKTFSHIFGANTNPLEHFLIQHDIMGPCWLNLEQCTKLGNDLSWCALNIGLDNPQCCSVVREERDAPPLNVMSLSLQTKMSRLGAQSNQVVAASFFLCKDVNIDTLDYTTGLNGCRSTIICLPPNMSYPADAYQHIEQAPQHSISLENTEFALLSRLLAAIHVYDPDIISGHNFFGGDLDILLTRMKQLRVPHWHKLGRLKSKMLPKTSGSSEGAISSTFYQRLHMRGRIVCDTFEASQDLIKSKSFHLSELAKTQLDIVRNDIKPHQLDSYYKTGPQLVALAKHCSLDAYLAFALMTKLQILPLTKQLTRLSGNLWSRSIHGARSERNEYLLLHTFYKKGYICPDRPLLAKKHSFEFVDEALEMELPASKRRLGANGKEMPSFEGGLVLDPKTGIYDTYVLLLDFNSLYPSIMQEFNVCFTTMDVNAEVIDTEAQPMASQQIGILPALVKMFVDRRKRVKQLMNDPGVSATAKAQYQIEQMGLKLTANSMYGCLGSSYSRFFARPLAAFITAKGRDILRETVDIAQHTNSVDVIYGDTDSIMINTHQKVFSRANNIGQQLKQQVNIKYNMLEIDIDGVFRRTLLLKKKKYAAQMVTKEADGSYKESLEVKGLDIVRRDGCDLSRATSEHVLQLVLSNQSQETIVNNIHEYIKMVANRVHASEVPVDEYIIRKQLTKSPEEYRTTKGNPHVLVAKDMRRSGIAVKSGDTIPYIYCTTTNMDGEVVREPRMPDDVTSGKAVIDKDWYLLKQVLPSVDRICIPLEGTDRTKLTACLHINTPTPPPPRPRRRRQQPPPSSIDESMQIDPVPVIEEEEEEEEEDGNLFKDQEEESSSNMMLADIFKIKGQHRSKPLLFNCSACDRPVPSSKWTCTCGASLSEASLYCQTSVAVRRFIQTYYASPLICTEPACGFETRDQFPVDDVNCLQMNCPGKLIRQYSAGQLYDQIAAYRDIIQHLGDQGQDVSSILIMLDTLIRHSAYNFIDLNAYV